MQQRGFRVDFPPTVAAEVELAREPSFDVPGIRDLTTTLWSSIDNDDSRDLDQLEFAESEGATTRVLVAIANVSVFVQQDSATDQSARHNTTSVYTGVQTFPMLPERLSTDLSSLNEGQKRLAVVVEMSFGDAAELLRSDVFPAVVQNHAQLTYSGVVAWLETTRAPHSPVTDAILNKITASTELQEQLRIQDRMAQTLRSRRHNAGALDFSTREFRPTIEANGTVTLKTHEPDRATQLIEEFMIAANEAVDGFLQAKGLPSLQRVVRTPKNWPRMAALAAEHGGHLPETPDGPALESFLAEQRRLDPEHFPDLSLAMIQLIGRGEYVVKTPDGAPLGHFGLAAVNYAHSTAPNRRYPDLVTQRLLRAAFGGDSTVYSARDLEALATHCTEKEADANKVERQVKKCLAALSFRNRIGEIFSGFITGASEKGVWIRINEPPVEGKLVGDVTNRHVGDRVQAQLVRADPTRGFIDFELLSR